MSVAVICPFPSKSPLTPISYSYVFPLKVVLNLYPVPTRLSPVTSSPFKFIITFDVALVFMLFINVVTLVYGLTFVI